MTDEEYYNIMDEMFASDGWKQLIEELADNASNINSVEATKDENDLFFRKGQLNSLAFILNLESTIDHNRKEASNESL
tara:strand:- start:9497 stop:9730 length:234 start_codon:yes stop_codon:yes gene_type:complete